MFRDDLLEDEEVKARLADPATREEELKSMDMFIKSGFPLFQPGKNSQSTASWAIQVGSLYKEKSKKLNSECLL